MNSYLILENKLARILESTPEVIIFDLKHVHYINGRALRVILRTITHMKQQDHRVHLLNLQEPIKEMFETMNGLMPPWIFSDPQELENRLSGSGENTYLSVAGITHFE